MISNVQDLVDDLRDVLCHLSGKKRKLGREEEVILQRSMEAMSTASNEISSTRASNLRTD